MLNISYLPMADVNCTGVPRGGRGVSGSTTNESSEFLNFMFSKNTVQALLLNSLNPKFCTGKRQKIVCSFHILLQLLGDEVPQTPYRGFAPGPPDPAPQHVNSLRCKILGTPMVNPTQQFPLTRPAFIILYELDYTWNI